MTWQLKLALEYLGVLAIALVFTVIPGGGSGLDVILMLLSIAFFVGIGLLGYRLYRENRLTLDNLTDHQRTVLYGSIGGAFVVFASSERLFGEGGVGVLAWICLLALCSYGVFWVYVSYSRYE